MKIFRLKQTSFDLNKTLFNLMRYTNTTKRFLFLKCCFTNIKAYILKSLKNLWIIAENQIPQSICSLNIIYVLSAFFWSQPLSAFAPRSLPNKRRGCKHVEICTPTHGFVLFISYSRRFKDIEYNKSIWLNIVHHSVNQ